VRNWKNVPNLCMVSLQIDVHHLLNTVKREEEESINFLSLPVYDFIVCFSQVQKLILSIVTCQL